MIWYKTDIMPPEFGIEVLGFHKDWIDEDYNKDGVRVCFLNDSGEWQSAMWCGYHDEYHTTSSEEADEEHPQRLAPTDWMPKPTNPLILSLQIS